MIKTRFYVTLESIIIIIIIRCHGLSKQSAFIAQHVAVICPVCS